MTMTTSTKAARRPTSASSSSPMAEPYAAADELDLDAFLRSHSASFSDSDSDSAAADDAERRRAVDHLLLSSSDSDEPKPQTQTLIPKPQNPSREASPSTSSASDSTRRSVSASPTLSSLVSRTLSNAAASSSSSASRPLPSLFRGVRPSPKPGAALAAAAAASRSVPTPHAAAIKSRRSAPASGSGSFHKLLDEDGTNSEALDGPANLDAELEKDGVRSPDPSEVPEEVGVSRNLEAGTGNGDLPVPVVPEETGKVEASKETESVELQIDENGKTAERVEQNLAVVVDTIAADGNEKVVDEDSPQADQIDDLVAENVTDEAPEFGEHDFDGNDSVKEEEMQSENPIDKLIEERVEQLEINRKAEKKAEKLLKASMKPLEWAEELEKRQASFGQHWQEGAAAQPMRLEGIRRGPPAIGYLQIDLDNSITRAVSSQGFRRDHGSPQVLAVHKSYIALGMSKGAVIVVPSKYSVHHADDTDAKMLFFWNQAEKAQSPVTAMCFNQQGDLLLVGYGDGHLTIWDVLKAAAAKVIYGEHTAPVVHASFLRQSKAITGDSKGLVLLHTFSIVPLLNRLTIKSTQRLFDGQSGIVLSASPLLVDESFVFSNSSAQGNSTMSSGGLGSMMGGVVGGVVGVDSGWKLFNEGSLLVEDGVVIFVMHQNALVVRLGSTVEHIELFSRPDGAREGSIAYTAWKCTTFSNDSSLDESKRVSWLAIAWDRHVQVAKLVKSKMKKYKEWKLDSAAIGVVWLDDQMLVILTLRGQLCLFSKDGSELHRTSFILDGFGIDDIILYHTHFSNIFGNPEKHFNNSVSVRGATIYILGPTHLIVSRLLPWKERIEALKKAGDWMGALDMAMRLYDGQTQGVVDLPRIVDSIREAIMPYLVELLLSYIGYVFEYISIALSNQTGKGGVADDPIHLDRSLQTETEEQYARVGGVAVEYCVHIRRADILFDTVFSKFVAVQNGGTFLEVLEPYILKDMLGSLPPEIMQALVEHYSSKGWLQRVEQCILHMDISSLDFNQVVRLCREHGLYGALIYLFNQGLNDFRTPLEELLVVVQNGPRKDACATCYRMLVYLKYCFQGLAFPPGHGTLPQSHMHSVREELLQFLLEESKSVTSAIFKGFKSSCGKCPNLCYLLWMDTEATLDVLRCAFSEEWLEDIDEPPNNLIASPTEHEHEVKLGSLESPNVMVQNIVDTIIDVLGLENEVIRPIILGTESEHWPSEKDLSCLIEFISFVVSHKRATASQRVIKHILDYLTSPNLLSCDDKNASASPKEKQVLRLLNVIPQADWNSDDVLDLCSRAHFHQACGFIYTARGQNVAALDSYMKDVEEPFHAFVFINKILLKLVKSEASSFRSTVISRFPELVKLSRECTFVLVVDHFQAESQQILSELHSDSQSLFLYLKTAMEVHLSGKIDISGLNITKIQIGTLQDSASELKEYLDRLSNFPKLMDHNPVHITDDLVELYLELLCQYERSSVLKFLETFDSYRLERCLRLCQDYGVTDAAAFLLERVGDVGSALSLLVTELDEKINLFTSALENAYAGITSKNIPEIEQPDVILKMSEALPLLDMLHSSIGLCQRNSQRLDPEESQSLWFRLLDSFSGPLKRFCGGKDVSVKSARRKGTLTPSGQVKEEPLQNMRLSDNQRCSNILRRVFSQFVGEIIEAMAGYIPLPVIMAKLLSDNGHQEFGDFKLVILRMLATYGYEKRILDTAKSVIEDDTFYTLRLLKTAVCHALAPQDFICCICNCSLSKGGSASAVRVFNCGHLTHLHCESEQSRSSNSESVAGCPICLPKSNAQARNKSAISEKGLVNYSLSDREPSHGIQHLHEPDHIERSRGLQQMSRFEILNNLQKAQKSFHIETLPQLRLAPPAIYHEKIQKRTSLVGETSKSSVIREKPHKIWQLKESKSKGSANQSPLKSSIFSSEKNQVR